MSFKFNKFHKDEGIDDALFPVLNSVEVNLYQFDRTLQDSYTTLFDTSLIDGVAPVDGNRILVRDVYGNREQYRFSFAGLTPASINGKYILVSSPINNHYIWFNNTLAPAVDPAIPGRIGIRYDYLGSGTISTIVSGMPAILNGYDYSFSTNFITYPDTLIGESLNRGAVLNQPTAGNSGSVLTIVAVGTTRNPALIGIWIYSSTTSWTRATDVLKQNDIVHVLSGTAYADKFLITMTTSPFAVRQILIADSSGGFRVTGGITSGGGITAGMGAVNAPTGVITNNLNLTAGGGITSADTIVRIGDSIAPSSSYSVGIGKNITGNAPQCLGIGSNLAINGADFNCVVGLNATVNGIQNTSIGPFSNINSNKVVAMGLQTNTAYAESTVVISNFFSRANLIDTLDKFYSAFNLLGNTVESRIYADATSLPYFRCWFNCVGDKFTIGATTYTITALVDNNYVAVTPAPPNGVIAINSGITFTVTPKYIYGVYKDLTYLGQFPLDESGLYFGVKSDGTVILRKDMEVNDIGSGVILKSPDGRRWRTTVSSAGVLTTVLI